MICLDNSTWKRVAFGDVVRNINVTVRDPDAAGVDRIIAMEHMDPGELKISRWGSLDDGTTFTRLVKPGQTLFGKRRAYQRKVAYAEFDAICSGDIYTFAADESQMLPAFLPFLVQSNRFFDHALGTSAGSLSPRTNWRYLASFEFALPTLDEQKRIVDLLWAIERNHEATTELLLRLRRARTAHLNTFVTNAAQRAPVRSFALTGEQPVQVGPFGGTLASRHFKDSGVRVLKIQNITSTSRVDLGYSVFVSCDHAASLDRYRLREGDTVIVAQGATVGKTAIVDAAIGDTVISQHLIRVRLDPERAIPQFAALMIQSADFQRQIDTVRTKSTRDGLNTDDVARFDIPDVSLRSQQKLVGDVAEFDRAIELLGVQLGGTTTLKASLLSEIFGGE